MKYLIKFSLAVVLVLSTYKMTVAQSSAKDKKALKAAAVKKMVDSANYIFDATYVIPMRGGSRQLTSEYDLKVTRDTITAFLPYFGRAYLAPYDPTDGGIKFTSTKFTYTSKQNKKGNWDVIIKPRDTNMTDWRDVRQIIINIGTSGYASMQVISTNRDPITFNGTIEPIKHKVKKE